jgi:predicted DNA-binding ribbon-helix-helix protein
MNRTARIERSSAIVKRSVTLAGHSTSVSLESEFWEALKGIASQRGVTLPSLITAIDETRKQSNLSSAIRVHVLQHFTQKANGVDRHETDGVAMPMDRPDATA